MLSTASTTSSRLAAARVTNDLTKLADLNVVIDLKGSRARWGPFLDAFAQAPEILLLFAPVRRGPSGVEVGFIADEPGPPEWHLGTELTSELQNAGLTFNPIIFVTFAASPGQDAFRGTLELAAALAESRIGPVVFACHAPGFEAHILNPARDAFPVLLIDALTQGVPLDKAFYYAKDRVRRMGNTAVRRAFGVPGYYSTASPSASRRGGRSRPGWAKCGASGTSPSRRRPRVTMNGKASTREARLQLALTMTDDPSRREEAEAELRQALSEPGGEPPDWRLHFHLGELASDRAAALSEFLTAVLAAPTADAGGPAEAGLALLDGRDAPNLASRLDAQDVHKLIELVEREGSHLATIKLAVHILVLRGEVEEAGPLLSVSVDSQIKDDPALHTANIVSRALELVTQGDDEAALGLLTEQHLPPDEPAAATVRALALYGLGHLEEALQALIDTVPTFEIAAVRALVWLRRAAASAGDKRQDAITEADRAASEAARLDPSRGDGLLLRAQVALEGTPNIESGRKLLIQAVSRLDAQPEREWLWRVQQRVRGDDLFRYMTFEVAAACGRRDELLALRPEELPFAGMTLRQDAALAELAAVACRGAGRLADAVEFFEAAVEFYDQADQPDRELEVRQALAVIRPTVTGSLELAERWWAASFRAEAQGSEAVTKAVQRGLAVLDELDMRAPDQEPEDRTNGAYMRGLLLTRLQSPTWRDWWVPLPWLLVAALGNSRHSYRATFLAFALGQTMLLRSALHYAERALDLEADDPWVQQAAIFARLVWHGMLDADTTRLLDGIEDVAWRETIRAFDAMLRGDLADLHKLADRITFDALWARELRANAVTRLMGPKAAQPLWLVVLDEARKAEPPDRTAAITAALALRDVEMAREQIDAGANDGTLSTLDAKIYAALVGLVVGDNDSLGRAVEYVRDRVPLPSPTESAHAVLDSGRDVGGPERHHCSTGTASPSDA